MSNTIKILFIGDIVGRAGRFIVRDYLAGLNTVNTPDFVIANGENASHGFGLTEKNHNDLIEYGINCITSGNHIWDKKDIINYIDTSPALIRPLNYPEGTPGVGYKIFDIVTCKIAVINLLGRTYMNPIDSPWNVEEYINEIKKITPNIIIDFHAEASAEKVCFGIYCANLGITAVMGTHTHIQTADEKIIKNTGYITDVGFCGAANGVIGMDYESSLKRLITSLPERFDVAVSNESQFNGVLLTVDYETGATRCIERINFTRCNNEVDVMQKG